MHRLLLATTALLAGVHAASDAEAPLTSATTINADGETVRKPTILMIGAGKMTSTH
jgi:hypothetical protein